MAVCRVGATAPRTMRRFVQRTAEYHRIDADTAGDLALVCTELVTNALVHSGSRDVTVSLRLGTEHVLLGVDDHGHWRKPDRCGDPLQALGGRGLDLVRAIATTWIQHTPAGTRVRCRIPLTAPDATGPHEAR